MLAAGILTSLLNVPHSGYWITRLVFQRGLALVYLTAFLVAVNQFRPLLGERGLLPATLFIERVPFRQSPSLFYLCPNDTAFRIAAWLGVALSSMALAGLSERYGTWVSAAIWAGLWLFYLSFVNVGQTFYAFGWESILLEAGFFAIFAGDKTTDPQIIVILILRWVLFRVMFGAGLIKLRGDSCWRDLTCLDYHYETQPIPNPLSWYFHWAPAWTRNGGVLFNHFVELAVPFGYFAPQPAATVAGLLTIVFQSLLMLSGNLSWLNLLTIILAISTLDDRFLSVFLPLMPPELHAPHSIHRIASGALAIVVSILSIYPIANMISARQLMNYSYNPVHLVNTYGAFGGITRTRKEIIVEGSDESAPGPAGWREYEFKGKPGVPFRAPPQIAPYHLRLDWLMWFAAMSPSAEAPWFVRFLVKLLEGDQQVLGLLRTNPFPGRPPRYVRALLYEYHFTTPQERRATGRWWNRTRVSVYFPVASLQSWAGPETVTTQNGRP